MKIKLQLLSGWFLVVLLPMIGLAADSDLQLLEAVKRGDMDAVRYLLKQQVDVDAPQADGATALAWAAHRNDTETVELLIRAGANVNVTNDYGVTPLSLACTNRNAAIVGKLSQAGADPNAAQITGETALMTCARTGNVEAVKLLLAHGADVNAREAQGGQTALMWTVAEKHPAVARLLIEYGADVNATSYGSDGYTPLLYAANHLAVKQVRSKASGFQPLLFAAQQGDIESARILLEAGADVNDSTPEYGNALVVACASGHEELALFLLDQGADPNVTDGLGITPLHYAVRKGLSDLIGFQFEFQYNNYYREPWTNLPKLVKALLAAGANPNVQIKSSLTNFPSRAPHAARMVGATPFFFAAVSADADLMRILAAGAADPLLAAGGNTTPLMVAAGGVWKGNRSEEEKKAALEAVKLAVEMGVDVNAANAAGETAMHAAAYTGADAIVEFLAKKGAQVNVEDMSGETPWTMAKGISPRPSRAGLYGNHPSTANLLVKLGANSMTPEEIEDFLKKAEAIPNLQRYAIPDDQSSGGGSGSETALEN